MKSQKFKKGNIIYFNGQNLQNKVYLCKSGEVLLTYDLPGNSKKKVKMRQGGFFGIKNAFGAKVVSETVQALVDTEVYILSAQEFLKILEKKPNIIFVILKKFFEELRDSHKEIEKKMSESEEGGAIDDSKVKLLNIGEYFESKGMYGQAQFVYERYLNHYPDGSEVDSIKDRIENVKNEMAND